MHMSTTLTPWGASQDAHDIADGITRHRTERHGGIHLSDSRWTQFRALFPSLNPWAGEQWFEQDCDVAAVIVAFPEFFDDRAIYHAVQTLRITGMNAHLAEARAYLATPEAAAVIAAHDRHAATIADRWSVGSLGTRGEKSGWWAFLTHTTTKEKTTGHIPRIPYSGNLFRRRDKRTPTRQRRIKCQPDTKCT
jgi:hypothetical protein